MKKVSIIIPVYKTEKYIEQCIQSLVDQTYRNIEIILINDGSPDKCGEICDLYAKNYPGLVKVIHQENQGVSTARNKGLAAALGEWIMFVDSDDWAEPDMVEIMLKKASAETSDICVCGDYIHYPGFVVQNNLNKLSEHNITPEEKERLVKNALLSTKWIGKYSENANLTGPHTKLYRAALLKENLIIFNKDIHLSEDIIFNLYAFQLSSKIVFCEKALYNYRMRQLSATKRYQKDALISAGMFINELNVFANRFYTEEDASIICNTGIIYVLYTSLILKYGVNDAPYTSKQRLNGIKEVVNQDIYKHAIANVSLRYISLGNRLKTLLLRYTSVRLFYVVFKILMKRTIRGE